MIQERLKRMLMLKQGLEWNITERTEKELELVNKQIAQDEERLFYPDREAEWAYCPSFRRICEREFCEKQGGGERCVSFERCYE